MSPLQLRDLVVRPVLKHMDMWSPVAENLVVGTAFQESAGGYYLKQVGGGPALGIYQIEPATHQDLWTNYLDYSSRKARAKLVIKLATSEPLEQQLVSNLSYATAIARLVYYRRPEPLPVDSTDVKALAEYWKRYYNTVHGKGTVEEFVRNFPQELLTSNAH